MCATNTIDSIWIANTTQPELVSDHARQSLSPSEVARFTSLSKNRAHQFLAARSLARRALSHQYHKPLDHWRITAGGRPEISPPNTKPDLSISHSHSTVICGLSATGKIGVDIEPLNQQRDWRALAQFSLPVEEFSQLPHQSEEELKFRFLASWTLREAYSKASGVDLTAALRELHIHWLTAESAQISTLETTNRWQFGLFLYDQQVIAWCRDSRPNTPHPPAFYRWVNATDTPETLKPDKVLLHTVNRQ